MTDSTGFPPFKPRAAAPKEQAPKEQAQPKPEPELTEQQFRQIESLEPAKLTYVQETRGPVTAALEVPEAAVSRLLVCADCGSRRVRQAVLVDGEVYVKL